MADESRLYFSANQSWPSLLEFFQVLKLRDFELINVESKLVLSKECYVHRSICCHYIWYYHFKNHYNV